MSATIPPIAPPPSPSRDARAAKWRAFRQTKSYDFIVGVPLILWFGNAIREVRPPLVESGRALLTGDADLLTGLQFFAILSTVCFSAFLIYMVTVRVTPVLKSQGLVPRLSGFLGTFLGVGIIHLRIVHLSLPWQAASDILIFCGQSASFLVLASLGKGFSIMPEARRLVTAGPYRVIRHPLYVAEAFTLAGTAIQFVQPWAALLALGAMGFQILRSVFEERVLMEAFPDYAAYRARTWRFIPAII